MRILIPALCASALFVIGGCKSGPEPTSGRPSASRFDVGPGQHIPELARSLIRERMHLHGDDMSDLLWAVLFLDYDSMKAIAEDLASSPKFSRPLAPDDLNASIPEQFFDLQDQLNAGARQLSAAAQSRDGGGVAASFAEISQSCVRCHSLYLDEPKSDPVVAPELE